MENQFKYWGIDNYTRVPAHDGRGDNDLGEILKGKVSKSNDIRRGWLYYISSQSDEVSG